MSFYRPLALAAGVATLAACATVPQPLQGNYPNVPLQSAQQGAIGGTRVRWGGEIIKTEPTQQETCFYVMARTLDDQARPKAGDDADNQGRFVACRAGFYDPEVFTRGRDLTVTGTVHGTVSRKVGDYDYAYPRVQADVVYLWPKRVPVNYGYGPYGYGPGFYDPFWGPGFGPWGDPFWYGGGFYGPRRVIVVPRRGPPSMHK